MGSRLIYLVFAILIALWLFFVFRSCNGPKADTKADNTSITNTTDTDAGAGETAEEADLEDLYEVDENDVKAGDTDQSEELPNNANAGDDLEIGNAGDPEDTAVEEDEQEDTAIKNGSTFGKYLVVTGSFLSEANAEIMAKRLQRMGYNAAEVVTFDLSQYYSVTAGRYSHLSEASSIAKNLKLAGEEAYVHLMRGKRVK